MSQFKKRLTELFTSAYPNDSNEVKESLQTYHSTINEKSNANYPLKKSQTQSKPLPIGQSKRFDTQSKSNSVSYSNYDSKPTILQSFLKKRGITTDILNDSTISPLYTEKSSFSQLQTDASFNSQIMSYRLNSRNKHQSRIKKEIDNLSKSFKEGIIVQNNLNRPMVSMNKPEYQNFSINFISSIAFIKEKAKENRSKNKDQKYVAYPSSNGFLMNSINKRIESVSKGNGNGNLNKPKEKIALKNDINDLYEYLSQLKKKSH